MDLNLSKPNSSINWPKEEFKKEVEQANVSSKDNKTGVLLTKFVCNATYNEYPEALEYESFTMSFNFIMLQIYTYQSKLSTISTFSKWLTLIVTSINVPIWLNIGFLE